MKTTIQTAQITQADKTYKQGTLEIDTEQNQLTLKTTTGAIAFLPPLPFMKKKEKTLATTTYNENEFPQLDGNTLTIQNTTIQIPNLTDQQTITDTITKPHQTLRTQIENELNKAENTLKDTLETRAETLDYLTQLKNNPRRTLYQTNPDLLANNENPVEETIRKQKTNIQNATTNLRTYLAVMTKNNQINQETQDTLTRIAIAIAAAQDAQFQNNPTETQTTNQLLQTMGATQQNPPNQTSTIKQNTQTLTTQLTAKTRQTLIDNKAGTTQCPKCKKYQKPNQPCPNCNPPNILT